MDIVASALLAGIFGLAIYLCIALTILLVVVLIVLMLSLIIYAISPPDKRLENVYNFIDYAVKKLENDGKPTKTKKPIKFFDDEQ